MGNTNAAILTSNAIDDLSPKYVIMFGLAGGISGAVALGDVVVSTKIYYYESGKEYQKHFEDRPTINNCNDFLLRKAHSFYHEYSESENLKFGVIASGEKVISSTPIITELKSKINNLVAIEMESFGVSQGAIQSTKNPGFIAIRGISDLADEAKNDNFRELSLNNGANFLKQFLDQLNFVNNDVEPRSYISIKHLSLYQRSEYHISEAGYSEANVYDRQLDLTDCFDEDKSYDVDNALNRQINFLKQLKHLREKNPGIGLKYFGLAHIPLTFHMGMSLNRTPVELFNTDRQSNDWISLSNKNEFPKLNLSPNYQFIEGHFEEIIIRANITQKIQKNHNNPILKKNIPIIDIGLEEPQLDCVTSIIQVNEYAKIFLKLIDFLHRKLMKLNSIHLFLACPPPIAFRFGQQISPIHHADVIVYNFYRRATPNYEWAININQEKVIYFNEGLENV